MAIKLVYDSCLFEEALDDAIREKTEYEQKVKEQEAEKKAWEEEQEKIKEEMKEKAPESEQQVPEVKEWEKITMKDFIVEEKTFVIGLDTLGQDRQLTEEQKEFVINTAMKFRDTWNEVEK